MQSNDDYRKMLANPFYCIKIAEGLFRDHEPLVSREQWIAANKRMIREMGIDAWLKLLLDVLTGDYLTAK